MTVRRHGLTQDRVLAIAKSKGVFSVSLRYRDEGLMALCRSMVKAGLLVGGRREGRYCDFYPNRRPKEATS